VISGVAPAGTQQVLAIDAAGQAFPTTPAADGSFRTSITSTRPISLYVVGDVVRVLRLAGASGAATRTMMPNWSGEVALAQLTPCDCDHDGVDNDVGAQEDPLGQIDTDGDGVPDATDTDSDGDGTPNASDTDADGDGTQDAAEACDSNHNGTPDLVDDDSGTAGTDDADGDGVSDDNDQDDDNDGVADSEDHQADNGQAGHHADHHHHHAGEGEGEGEGEDQHGEGEGEH
jgi:hypothetical protein